MANQIQNKQVGRYQPYPEYKDSGVEWLGKIPSHWEVIRLKYLCDITTGNKDTVNAINTGKYPFFVRSQTIKRIDDYTFDCEAVLTAGDGAGVGKIYHHYCGKFGCHQRVYALINFKHVKARYIFYYLFANFSKVALDGNSKSTVDSLRLPQFQNFEISLPKILKQKKIIQFLDYETAKIDLLIEKQQKLIELLKEKRQAVISHAITKGLDPNVEMKDSGVEWLGKIPSHWELSKIKYIAPFEVGWTPPTKYEENFIGENLWANISDLKDKFIFTTKNKISDRSIQQSGMRIVPKGSLLYSFKLSVGNVSFAGNNLYTNEAIASFLVNSKLPLPYLYYALPIFIVKNASINIYNALILNQDLIKNAYLLDFSYFEAQKIAQFLDDETAKIDLLIEKAEAQITLMQERRTALISAAVTGKIDLRHWQMPEVSDHQGGDYE